MNIPSPFEREWAVWNRIRQLKELRFSTLLEIEYWEYEKLEYQRDLSYRKLGSGQIQKGSFFDPSCTYRFHRRLVVDHTMCGQPEILYGDFGGEASVYFNGELCGSLDRGHEYIYLPASFGDGEIDISIEVCSHAQDFIRSRRMYDTPYPSHQYYRSFLASIDRDIERSLFLFESLYGLSRRFLKGEAFKSTIARLDYCGKLLASADGRAEIVQGVNRDLSSMIRELKPRLPAEHLYLSGHSHLDLLFKWDWKETVQKAGRTYANVVSVLSRHPGIFMHSQMILAELLEERYPKLLEKIVKLVDQGRIELVGDFWCEFDANMISMESMIEQIRLGRESSRRIFGRESRIAYLPDTFGFPAYMPQILRAAGYDYFVTTKLYWNEGEPFPHNRFVWEGIDGSRIRSYLPTPSYESELECHELFSFLDSRRQEESELFVHYGLGDGGGGVSDDIMKRKELYREEELFSLEDQSLHGSLKRLFPRDEELPVVEGELYLDTHQGTLTSGAEVKRLHRLFEARLCSLEFLAALVPGGCRDVRLKKIWKRLGYMQFHDSLAASLIKEAYEGLIDCYHTGLEEIRSVEAALLTGMDGIAAFSISNSSSFRQTSYRELSLDEGCVVKDRSGRTVPGQRLDSRRALLQLKELDPCSITAFYTGEGRYSRGESRAEGVLDNGLLRICIDEWGQFSSLYHHPSGRELLKAPGNRACLNHLSSGYFSAWNFGPEHRQVFEELNQGPEISLVEEGDLMQRVFIRRARGGLKMVQEIRLYAEEPFVDIQVQFDGLRDDQCLSLSFPLALESEYADSDIGAGFVSRPTRGSRQIESLQHGYTSISEERLGLALISRDKYGISFEEGELSLRLGKSSVFPAPDMDSGRIKTHLRLLVHENRRADMERRSGELNGAVHLLPASLESDGALFSPESSDFLVKRIKPCEDQNSLMIRVLEFQGKRIKDRLLCARVPEYASWCKPLGEEVGAAEIEGSAVPLELEPFEIKTLRLRYREKLVKIAE